MHNFILIAMLSIVICQAASADEPTTELHTRGTSVVTVGPANDSDCDYNTINQAVLSGSDEIRIMTLSFPFVENIIISNKNISLIGGYQSCIDASQDNRSSDYSHIMGNQTAPVITIINDAGNYQVHLENLVISNGARLPLTPGAGVVISGSNTEVTGDNLRIESNRSSGIGVSNNNMGLVNLTDTVIQANTARDGGGIHCTDSNVQISGASLILDNRAIGSGVNAIDEGTGGGVYAGTGCALTFYSGPKVSQFNINGIRFNQANFHGGGIYAEAGAEVTLVGQAQNVNPDLPNALNTEPVNLVGNEADSDDNDIATHGGAIYAIGENTLVSMNGVRINNNTTPGNGGAVALYDQAQLNVFRDPAAGCWSRSKCNDFSSNQASSGGAIYAVEGSSVLMSQAWLTENEAEYGTAAYLGGTDTFGIMDGVVINNNDSSADNANANTVISLAFGAELIMQFSSVIDNYVSEAIFGVVFADMDMYGTLVYQEGALPVSGVVNGSLTANCMYVYNDSGMTGTDILTTGIDPMVDRTDDDFHLNENNQALDRCAPSALQSGHDMDNEPRGWDDPMTDAVGVYDIGADESYASDVIFKSQF